MTIPRIVAALSAPALAAGLLGTTLLAQDAQQRRGFAIAITQPVNQEVVFGKTKIVADVTISNPDMVEKVEFVVGDDVIFIDREPPYECYFDFGEAQRSWIIRAVAYHVEGVTVSDAAITRRLKFATIERVNRVLLWVTATDKQGNLVTDLTREDFKILENGEEQKVLDFYHEERPITMAILLDTSGSMQEKIEEVHEAAGAFVETLRPQDQSLIIDFDDKVFLIQDLTAEHDALKEAIQSTEPLGATAMYDALHAAYRKIGQIDGRKVVILLSDGEDTASQFSFKRVLEEAQTNNTMIFTIGLGIEGGTPRKNVLEEFSDSTGGRYFFVKKAGQLAGTYERIAEELRMQYYLTYSTTNDSWDGHWIKIDVESKRPGVKVRARRGYYAVRSGG